MDLLARLPELQRLAPAATFLLDTARLAQDLPDRRLGTRQADIRLFELRIAVEERQDRFWPWDTLQVLISDF